MTFAGRSAKALRTKLQTSEIAILVEQLGVAYERLFLPIRIKGFTGRIDSQPYIVVNRALHPRWARVVAFHELGHIILHNQLPDQFFISEYTFFPLGRLEREANEFAAEYSIPDEALAIHTDIRVIAAELNVPVELFQFKRLPEDHSCCVQ